MAADAPCLVFGYGSVVHDESRAATTGGGELCCAARLLPGCGFARAWNFRAASGFTALGLQRCSAPSDDAGLNGVVFQLACAALAALDAREAGYERVRMPTHLCALAHDAPGERGAECAAPMQALLARPDASLWLYVPRPEACAEAIEAFPIVQSYLDVCLAGCLRWGGEAFASEWIRTTAGWSAFFLNDAPLSRRPWLHRGPAHAAVDALLSAHGELTRFAERRHPEEFAAQYLQAGARGCWGLPRRNPLFCGRDRELAALTTALRADGASGGVTQAELVGLGGVGKSQVATEYAHRGFASGFYGLVAWINAESAASVAGDLRRLAADSGVAVRDRPAAEVLEEVKSRLYRAHFPWLLVFDNLELSAEALSSYLPRGGALGHVVVTSRRASAVRPAVRVDCFDAGDSLAFLALAGGGSMPPPSPGRALTSPDADAAKLAEALGHLPLALAMAAAYMRRADVTCGEYAARLAARAALLDADAGGGDDAAGYSRSVASSLSLSLGRIAAESAPARAALDALAYCAPDGISKPLLRELLRHAMRWPAAAGEEGAEAATPRALTASGTVAALAGDADAALLLGASACAVAATALVVARLRRSDTGGSSATAVAATALGCGAGAAAFLAYQRRSARPVLAAAPPALPAAITAPPSPADAAEALAGETDAAWALLKTFSLLVVRDREASMHRLLQVVIRGRHSGAHARRCMAAAAAALRALWRFDAADAATWQAAGALVEHVQALGRAAAAHGCRCADASALLTAAGGYAALALSRFPEAEAMLRDALALAVQASRDAGGEGDDDAPGVADALFELARALRYQGRLGAAQAAATRALEARKRAAIAAGLPPEACPRVAAALHEAGVLRLRAHDAAAGEALLRAALAAKAAARVPAADTAATLHELAVAALNARPPRLDEAEASLRAALAAGGPAAAAGGAGACAAAATLQQLGRLAMRRGRLDEAEEALQRAGALARAAYASDRHVNVASCEHALGLCAAARGDAAAATEHLQSALRIRVAVYGDAPHAELATTHGALGKVARAGGDPRAAREHFAAQRAVLERLASTGPIEARRRAANELLESLMHARSAAREVGDKDVVAALSRDIAAAKAVARAAPNTASSEHQSHSALGDDEDCFEAALAGAPQQPSPTPPPSPLLHAAVRARSDVRAVLAAGRSDAAADSAELKRIAAALTAAAADSASAAEPGVAAAAAAFAAALSAPRNQAGELRGALFRACDDLRSAMRAAGVRVEDTVPAAPRACLA
jgi:hypothetical protein